MTEQQSLHLLGPVRVEKNTRFQNHKASKTASTSIDQAVPRFRSRRTMALLGYLVVERRPVTRTFLAAFFWPDEPPSKGRGNLRRELHNLSQILPDCWLFDRQTAAFTPTEYLDVDIYTILNLDAQQRWIEAAKFLGGDFLEALYLEENHEFENWIVAERDLWRWRTETILTNVIKGHTHRGHYGDAIQYCQRLLQVAPWKEEIHRQIMQLLTWTGQRGTAIRQFETCKQALLKELNVGPSEETITLFQKIQAGELDSPPQLPTFLTAEPRHDPDRSLLVARERELDQLDIALKNTLSGQGRVVFISGGPGRGKTLLMESFARQAMESHPNLLVASGNCNAFSGIGDPYLPFRDIISLLTGDIESKWEAGTISREHALRLWEAFPIVLDALLDHAPSLVSVLVPGSTLLSRAAILELTINSPRFSQLEELIDHQQLRSMEIDISHLYQQTTNMLRVIAKQWPLLLILDDMHWADTASISLLFHLGRRIAESDSKILILCALRPVEISTGRDGKRHPLAKALNELQRIFGDEWIELIRSEDQDAQRFVDGILDNEPNRLSESFRVALLQRTEAHPLFTVELLRTMQERGNLYQDENGRWVEESHLDWNLLPPRVEAVIEERIERLNPELREILSIASIEGEIFTAEVVSKVQGMSVAPLLRLLSMEVEQQHRLVREQAGLEIKGSYLSRFKFNHILFQNYIYKHLSLGEKRLLHTQVANAIEELYGNQLEEMIVDLAHHFNQAGDYSRAFGYYVQAADRAASIYANDAAAVHYSQAIRLARQISLDSVSSANLHLKRGQVYEILGEFSSALVDFEKALDIASAVDNRELNWRALIDLGKLWSSRNYTLTKEYFEMALSLARDLAVPEILAKSLNWIGNWHTNADDPQAAVEFHQEALVSVETMDNPQELANTLDLLGINHLMGGNLIDCARYYNRSITLYRELDDRSRLVSSLTGRSATFSMLAFLSLVSRTPYSQAIADGTAAIKTAEEIGSASDLAWAYWAVGLVHTVNSQFDEALLSLHRGLEIANEIGHTEFAVGNQFALGALYNELFDTDQALEHLQEAVAMAKVLESRTLFHISIGTLAGTYLVQNNIKLAKKCLDEVISDQTQMDTVGKRYCWVRQAEVALAQGDPERVIDIVERLISTAPGIGSNDVVTYLWMLKGQALAHLNSWDDAIAVIQTAIYNAQKFGERFLLWRMHASLGHFYKEVGNSDTAASEFLAAKELIEELAATLPDEIAHNRFKQGAFKLLNQ